MSVNFSALIEEVNQITESLKKPKKIVPPAPLIPKNNISAEDEIKDELDEPQYKDHPEDARYITKCYKYLRKLGLVENQYQFSEQFLNKNKYYYGMILCEQRHPSVDSIHNLIRNISMLNDGLVKHTYFDRLYEEGQSMITKRLLKYF